MIFTLTPSSTVPSTGLAVTITNNNSPNIITFPASVAYTVYPGQPLQVRVPTSPNAAGQDFLLSVNYGGCTPSQ